MCYNIQLKYIDVKLCLQAVMNSLWLYCMHLTTYYCINYIFNINSSKYIIELGMLVYFSFHSAIDHQSLIKVEHMLCIAIY